jgi:hypothetical protein
VIVHAVHRHTNKSVFLLYIVYKPTWGVDSQSIPMKPVLLALALIPLVLFVQWSMTDDGSDSLATAVTADYDSSASVLDQSIHAMMRNRAVGAYRKFNHDMERVEGSLLVARVGIMHHMRKALNNLEESVFREPFIQTSRCNWLELRAHNSAKRFTKTSRYDSESRYLHNLDRKLLGPTKTSYDFDSHYLDNIIMPNTARLVAKTIAARKGVWVVRMEQTLDNLQAELSDAVIVADLDATHPVENEWVGGILSWVVVCVILYAVYLECFKSIAK